MHSVKTSAKPKLRFLLKLVAALFGILLVTIAVGFLYLRGQIKANLPALDGTRQLAGLSAPVQVDRDDLGVVSLHAEGPVDMAQALGYVHAQDRFFQMEYYRRSASGELAEMLGGAMLEQDLEMRNYRFRDAAERVVANASPQDRALLEAYAEGVNQGLASLEAKPFELILLGIEPRPWEAADSVLVAYFMYEDLQDPMAPYESSIGLIHDLLPADLAAFLTPLGTPWDAPVVGQPLPSPPIPTAEVFDLRGGGNPVASASVSKDDAWPDRLEAGSRFDGQPLEETVMQGSNGWAVAGDHTASGAALVANDMHQYLNMPNVWYRASMYRPDAVGGEVALHGVTLPGLPTMIVGSNTHIAWSFTVSKHDFSDLIVLDEVPGQTDMYQTPDGPKPLDRRMETILVKGSDPIEHETLMTIWGPVVNTNYEGRKRVLRWVGHEPDAINLVMNELEETQTAEQALAVAKRVGAPNQNFIVGDADGNIGWTILGKIPRRIGFDGRRPTSWSDGSRSWDGWLSPEEVPTVLNPESGRLWSANARVAAVDDLALIGEGGYDMGARAKQIRDGLMALDNATPQDMLDIQLDDRALFLSPWRDLLLELLDADALDGHPRRAEFRDLVESNWTGHASTDSAGYRLVRTFRLMLSDVVFEAVAEPVYDNDEEFRFFRRIYQMEGPLWALVEARPEHLLAPEYDDWRALLLSRVDSTIEYLGEDLAAATWGRRNTVQPAHLFARVLPPLGRWLNPPAAQLAGDVNMPRLQNPVLGASERLVVAPGREDEAVFHMPGGQSGNPLSPFYTAGHEDWVEGKPSPLLPGAAVHTLRLEPLSGGPS